MEPRLCNQKNLKIMNIKKVIIFLIMAQMYTNTLKAQVPYAVLNNDREVLTFYYGTPNSKHESGGVNIDVYVDDNDIEQELRYCGSLDGLNDFTRRDIHTVKFDSSFADYTTLYSTANLFHGFCSMTEIEGIENLKTGKVSTMSGMFYKP